ncbi:peptidyl-Lys metalloendopeptidase [Rhizoctonia solani]|uniref:Peptidyl-Lys metalloendopeptidase n=1 Tax=Rhizoctonia solani TaxID=456999 RepID=A0A8H7I777_9AGAM|nr:peptidyl-Lys metalloendopeptidase [Rhizoctonia solani]
MILILILILVTLCGRVSTTRDLLLSLSVPNSAVSINELLVTSIVTNTGDHSLRLLNHPQTVLSHLPTRVFHISRGNITPDFTGLIVHYSPDYVVQKNNSDDFTFLDPGQTYERIHSLAGVYNFTGTGPDNSGKIVIVKAETNSTRFKISGGLVQSQNRPNRFNSFAQSTQMLQSGCTIDQQNIISEAAKYADQYISNALTYLQTINGYTPRYGAWFGAYGPQLAETVKFHYANMVVGRW